MSYMDVALNVYQSYGSYKALQPGKEGEWKKRNESAWNCLKRYGLLYG